MQKINLNSQSFSSVMTLIKKQCCNYYQGNCLLLDDGDSHTCPQRITPSILSADIFLAVCCRVTMLCLKALQVIHLLKRLTVLCAAGKLNVQAEIRSSVPTVQRRNRDRETQNICLQKGHGWMFMMS